MKGFLTLLLFLILLMSGITLVGCEEEEEEGTRAPTPGPTPASSVRIAFVSTRDGNFEVYVMKADGSGVTRLTDNPATDWSPAWSP